MDIYREIISALKHEDHIMLATVISTSGSTPASALSKMIIKNGGTESVGTIGGGCMESEVILQANRLYNSDKAEIFTFHLTEDDIESGLICGGSLDVLIEPLNRKQIPLFQKVLSIRDEGEDCVLGILLNNEKKIEGKIIFERSTGISDEWITNSEFNYSTTPSLQQSIAKSHHRKETIRLKLESGEIILEPITGTPTLIIFGGGHVSKFVSQAASMVGFRITVVDDREKYANPQRFPEAARTIVLDYADAVDKLNINQSTYIVIVTRGHKYDEIVLEQAIKTSAKYIGMIGSKRKVLTTYEHLRQRGITDEQLKRVHAPIGLDIGAVTAEEIAVSIVAELINIRRGGSKHLKHLSETLLPKN